MEETMRHKVENDAAAWLRSTVEKRGHNAVLAETTIREAKAFTEKESLDQHLIDLIAPSEQKLFEALEGREITRFDGLLIDGPPEIRIHLVTALSVSIPFALITMFLLTLALRARRNKSLMGGEGMIDEIGQARTALAPAGKVFVHGEYWDAESSSPVESGAEVRVVAVDGMKLRVEPKRGA
jgi:membrane-bound ClpP family serine protease